MMRLYYLNLNGINHNDMDKAIANVIDVIIAITLANGKKHCDEPAC